MRLLLILPAALAALLAPVATADAATARTTYPSITKIDPLNLAIGDTMTVTGRNFLKGKNRNTVVFKRTNQRAIFAKAVSATRTKLKVVVPEKLRPFLNKQAEQQVPTKFRVRILAKRFGRRYTKASSSPTIAPVGRVTTDGAPAADAPPPPAGPVDCENDGILDDVDTDDDNDHMTDAFEASIGTDRCKWDTDGDTLSDFWEYESALDLNLRALPYPGKRPYPNALDPDLNTDYDGDGMQAWQEHVMWVRYGNMGTYLNYSDGAQVSEPSSGLTDDRRDVDADGLPNWWEANGPMRRDWWKTIYESEELYPVVYADPDFLDPDSDGDGRLDGPDDLDHDGYSNQDELDRGWSKLPDKYDATAEAQFRWVQPHNPCLPDPESITCSLHPPKLDQAWPPFKQLASYVIPINDEFPRPLPLTLSPADAPPEPPDETP
ncbi:MAG TPA: IPT/TIG domain-containing protein [Solirubrobacteraceae bacterium]